MIFYLFIFTYKSYCCFGTTVGITVTEREKFHTVITACGVSLEHLQQLTILKDFIQAMIVIWNLLFAHAYNINTLYTVVNLQLINQILRDYTKHTLRDKQKRGGGGGENSHKKADTGMK